MYFKDIIRYWFNRLLKIDKDYLIRLSVLEENAEDNIKLKNGVYKLQHNGRTLHLRNLSSDFNVYFQILIEKEYELACVLFMKYFSRSPLSIIDVGANIGITSIYFSSLFPDTKILAIEAEASNYHQLLDNTKDYTNILQIHKAVWSSDTTLKISNDFRDGRSWSFRVNESTGFQIVESITLKQIMAEHNLSQIDILKLDVEGAEGEILMNDISIIDVLNNTNLLCLEIHDTVVSRIDLTDRISSLGFKIYSKGETLFAVR